MPQPVVLVHGAWHGAWCWERVIPLLEARGIEVDALELPLTSTDDDLAHTRAAIESNPGAVVMGHSYGGLLITLAARDLEVSHLVYLCAFMPIKGEKIEATLASAPRTTLLDGLTVNEDGKLVPQPDTIVPAFYADCDEADAANAERRLRPMPTSMAHPEIVVPAWEKLPSTYVGCTRDEALAPDFQRGLAARATRTVEWDTSHSPFYSRPDLVADLLAELS